LEFREYILLGLSELFNLLYSSSLASSLLLPPDVYSLLFNTKKLLHLHILGLLSGLLLLFFPPYRVSAILAATSLPVIGPS
jgi:hypothetical protein